MKNFDVFEQRIHSPFHDKGLLKQAFTHRSYLNENPSWPFSHNERLEFLGDAVIELIITRQLYNAYPDKPEGELTSYRAALVNANMLFEVASEIGIGDCLLLSRGEKKDLGRARQYILANAFEALVGAISIDQGYEAAERFVVTFLYPKMRTVLERGLWHDAKSLFQEKAQEIVGITPSYEVLKEEGPDHDRHFVVGIFLADEQVATGEGPSKQTAQQQAAEHALKIKGWA